MTTNDDREPDRPDDQASAHPEQVHPAHDAHGGSMAPGLVDDTGHPVEQPPGAQTDG